MSVSFWKAESKIPIEQTSKAITALNGLNFSSGQELRIKVPPTTQFIKPDECYIQADFKIVPDKVNACNVALQLDERLAGQSLIKDISIYSAAEKGSVLLEQITNYNSMVSVMRDYDTNDSIKNKRALTESSTVWNPKTRGTLGSTRSECADCTKTNPYFTATYNGTGNKVSNSLDYKTVKLQIPLETGIFRSPKVWVNMLTGLEIVITLEDAYKCVRPLDSVMRNRRLTLNPRFHSTNGSSAPDNWLNGSGTDTFYITNDNSNITPEQCPFQVGERLNFVDPTNSHIGSFDNAPIISEINSSATANNGDGLLEIKLDTVCTNNGSNIVAGSWFMYSDSLHTGDNAYKVGYSLSNVELVVQEVDMGSNYVNSVMNSMKEKGMIVHDILSAQNYRYSQVAGDVVSSIRLPLINSRAKSLICVPTDANVYVEKNLMNGHLTYDIGGSGNDPDKTLFAVNQFRGISDYITDYQFIYDGRLQPSRPVRCSKTSSKISIDSQPLIELTKALQQAEISGRSLADFNNNFIVSRALALNSGVYDTRNKDFTLNVNYQGTTPTKNKLWNNYCFHLRRIYIRGDSISFEV